MTRPPKEELYIRTLFASSRNFRITFCVAPVYQPQLFTGSYHPQTYGIPTEPAPYHLESLPTYEPRHPQQLHVIPSTMPEPQHQPSIHPPAALPSPQAMVPTLTPPTEHVLAQPSRTRTDVGPAEPPPAYSVVRYIL